MKVQQIRFGYEGKVHEFLLGLGPCGREVSALEVEINLATLTIKQHSWPAGRAAELASLSALHAELSAEYRAATGQYWRVPHYGDAGRALGWDNAAAMTPPKAAWDKAERSYLERRRKANDPENLQTHVFVYKLEDIEGRIKALEAPCKS